MGFGFVVKFVWETVSVSSCLEGKTRITTTALVDRIDGENQGA